MSESVPPSERTGAGFDLNRPTIVALLYLAGFLTGITGLVALVLAYVWKNEPAEPWEISHYRYHIRSFWYGLAGAMICAILSLILIGLLGFIALSVWFIVRCVLALLKAQRREMIADPATLLW